MKMVHITIHTARMEESVEFYENILGMTVQARFPGAGGRPIVFLDGDDSGVRIELIEDPEAAYSGAGLSVGFRVESVEEVYERMQRMGQDPSPMICPNPHTRFFFIEDPNGVSIQFI